MNTALIVAAGKGIRMGAGVDKLFLKLAGRPVIAHTWERFDAVGCINDVVLVVRDGMQNEFSELANKFGFRKPFRLVAGGKERQDSVWNGLQALAPACELVAIQDGARPCTPAALIEQTLQAAREMGAAVAAQRVTDTTKESHDGGIISQHLQRERLWAVQTPQAFRVEVIRKALQTVRERGLLFTDDTAACELIGQSVRLVESVSPNPKVTIPADVDYLELLLKSNAGHGVSPR